MQRIKKGFTMVELSFAMIFLSILSLVIIMVIMDAVSSYRRGLTLNQVNTVGMDLVDDMRTSIQASPARSVVKECTELFKGENLGLCVNEQGALLVTVRWLGDIKMEDADGKTELKNVPLYGVFCTGKYSYIWHSGYLFMDNIVTSKEDQGLTDVMRQGLALKYRTGTEEEIINEKGTDLPKLLKVQDDERMMCKKMAGYEASGNGTYGLTADRQIDISNVIIDEAPIDLLEGDNFSDLALFDLASTVPVRVEGVNSAFYSVSFILGTTRGGPNIKVSGNNCKPPEDAASEFDYCAINKFNFAAQAIGG